MSRYKVLVDSSVWIDYFKSGGHSVLDHLIEENLVCINEIIFTELVPALLHQRENEVLTGLRAIEIVPLRIDWEIVRRYQFMNLQKAINKVGIPDLIILQQVIDEKLSLFSFDKHFRLMKSHVKFDLFEE